MSFDSDKFKETRIEDYNKGMSKQRGFVPYNLLVFTKDSAMKEVSTNYYKGDLKINPLVHLNSRILEKFTLNEREIFAIEISFKCQANRLYGRGNPIDN